MILKALEVGSKFGHMQIDLEAVKLYYKQLFNLTDLQSMLDAVDTMTDMIGQTSEMNPENEGY